MDYSQLSDFEINGLVAVAAGLAEYMFFNVDETCVSGPVWTVPSGDSYSGISSSKGNPFEPCNDPADAWPIIQENRISIMFDGTNPEYEGEYHEWCDAISSCQKYGIQHQSNPLRAAMVVFLMMSDSDANP